MELPQDLQNLYRHWNYHIEFKPDPKTPQVFDHHIFNQIIDFAAERMHIWHKKVNREQPPFTTDPILNSYRFCNVYRELDKQTVEIHKSLNPLRCDFDLWLLNLAFNRFLCKPETFAKVGSLNFNLANNKKVMNNLLELPRPKYGTAYVFPISVIQNSQTPTREEFFTIYLPKVIPSIAQIIRNQRRDSVIKTLNKILPEFGFNFRFHWTEILIDIAYQFPELIDLYQDFPIGPGSLPTMIRLGYNDNSQELLQSFINYQPQNFPFLTLNSQPIWLSAENWEGLGCEYRKYQNLKDGSGRRRLYSQHF